MAAEFVGFRPSHDTESDIARPQQFHAGFAGHHLTTRRQNGRHINQVLLFDVGVAQRELKRREGMTMNAHAFGQEHAGRGGEHSGLLNTLARQRAAQITIGRNPSDVPP